MFIIAFSVEAWEVGAKDQTPSARGACTGSVWICESEIDDFISDMEQNCDEIDIDLNLVDC